MDDGLYIDVDLYAGLNRDGSIRLFAEVFNADNVFDKSVRLEHLLVPLAGYHVCGAPRGFKTQKDRREVEIQINNFERAAKKAVKAARAELSRYKTFREMKSND